jgi:FkbM family methyltransferase
MNYWGGAIVTHSGEEKAIAYAAKKLSNKSEFLVVDVGANLGQYATLASEVVGPRAIIYSFEPSKETFSRLQASTSSIESVRPVNLGLGEKEEILTLYSSKPASVMASLYAREDSGRREEIQISTLDKFCEKENINEIDFLKIDIEGHELFVLKGARRMLSEKKIRFIQFEFGDFHLDSRTFFRDFYSLLAADYTLSRVVSDGLVPIKEYSPELEVFATANYVAELKA